jgi:MYXO-CTERM domain-containing protein
VTGRYVLAEFINTTDTNTFRNLGGLEFVVNAVTFPEPMIGGLAATVVALVALVRRRRRPANLPRVAD